MSAAVTLPASALEQSGSFPIVTPTIVDDARAFRQSARRWFLGSALRRNYARLLSQPLPRSLKAERAQFRPPPPSIAGDVRFFPGESTDAPPNTVNVRPKGRTAKAACAPGTSVASGSRTSNHVEDLMVELFEPWLSTEEPPRGLSIQSNWPWMPTPERPSRADFNRPDPRPGDYDDHELTGACAFIEFLVRRRFRGPMVERLFDEAWTQFIVRPRAKGLPWPFSALRAYWRGEKALRSPEDLAREDARGL